MARTWRLRHKLVFGLALVVGSVVLLLSGTIFGLSSYFQVIQMTDRKLEEMQMCVTLREQIHRMMIAAPDESDPTRTPNPLNSERERIARGVKEVRHTLQNYEATLRQQFPKGSDGSLHDYKHIQDMRDSLKTLDEAVIAAESAPPTNGRRRLVDHAPVYQAHTHLERLSLDHFNMLVTDVKQSFDSTASTHRKSLVLTVLSTVLAIVLVGIMMYYFRTAVFVPIQLLQDGVNRVHRGNFSQPIQLQSKDELAELADEFNAMTSRLHGIYETLEGQVNERTRQLVNSERMVSVGFLAAGVAHEINNPLASIAFCAESLERRLHDAMARPGSDADVISKYLRMIQEESQRCKQITQKLLDFSRSGGKRESTDLTQLVSDVVEVAKVLPNARKREIIYEPEHYITAPVSLPDIKGVVLNLIVNALDSMDDGGRLSVELQSQAEFAVLRFRDTGCGMSAETLQHIFEPFFTRSRTGNGTGLGLSISHQIIDQHGGTIVAQSAGPGQGSTFIVRLPLTATSTEPTNAPATLLPFPGQRVSVA